MTTKVTLFLSMKDEVVARPLGLRRMRQAPVHGQTFQIPVDGRAVRARITRFSTATTPAGEAPVPDVFAEEI
jgi:hypothetical protein